MDERFQYTGDLAQEPLPEILRTIYFYRVPGVLTVESGGVTKKIYLLGGNIIFATSTDRSESLGQYLKRSALISSGELPTGVAKSWRNFSFTSGILMISAMAWDSLAAISGTCSLRRQSTGFAA